MNRLVWLVVVAALVAPGCFESHRTERPEPATCVPDSPMPMCNSVDRSGFCVNPVVRPPVTPACEWGDCPAGTLPTRMCPRGGSGELRAPDAGL